MYPFAHTFDYQQSTTFGFIGTYRINGIASTLHGLAISAKIRDSNGCKCRDGDCQRLNQQRP